MLIDSIIDDHEMKFINGHPYMLIDGKWCPGVYGGAEPGESEGGGEGGEQELDIKELLRPLRKH